MTHSQTQFFEPHPPTGQPSLDAAPATGSRRFYYDNQLFEDPGPEYTPQDILSYLSHTYPELRNGSWTSRTLPDGTEEVTFHKVTGEKGAVSAASRAAIPDRESLSWRAREVVGMGGYAVVYRIGPQALKVGRIEPDEVDAQRYFAAQGLALPVLAYEAELDLPEPVSREVCPQHGLRQEILPPGQATCSCGQPQAALLMPLTEPDLAGVEPLDVQAFIVGFTRDCETQLGRYWDARPSNVAHWQGRLVALDFGQSS